MAVIFPGSDCVAVTRALQGLHADMDRIGRGIAPTEADLAHAPLIDGWSFGVLPAPCLQGCVYGHPILGQRPSIHTSWLVAVDPVAGWGRTWSRFYRLGYPAGTFSDRTGHG